MGAQEHPVKRVANIVTVALEEYAKGGYRQPLAGFWTSEEIAPGP